MKGGILKRFSQFVITLIGATFLTFCLTYIAPGDPAMMVLETADMLVSQETIDETRREMGLDKPFLEQYVHWVGNAIQGDLGVSYSAKKPVTEKLWESLPGTALVATLAIVMMLVISVPLGVISALKQDKWPDKLLKVVTFIGVSMPNFCFGLLLLYVFGLKFGLFTIGAARVTFANAILPAATLAFYLAGKFIRQLRLIILEELQKDYVMGARARGMSDVQIMAKHVLPNAILPVITILGMSMGWLLGGVAVVEMVFAWPGLGRMVVGAIAMRDYPLIEGFVLWAAIAYMTINFLVDLSYSWLDPRLRKGE